MTHIQSKALFSRTAERMSLFIINRHPFIVYTVAFFLLPALGTRLVTRLHEQQRHFLMGEAE